jgi:hypothetical protein
VAAPLMKSRRERPVRFRWSFATLSFSFESFGRTPKIPLGLRHVEIYVIR